MSKTLIFITCNLLEGKKVDKEYGHYRKWFQILLKVIAWKYES